MVREVIFGTGARSATTANTLHQSVTDLWENGAAWFLDGVGTVESLETMRVRVVCYPNPPKVTSAYAVASSKNVQKFTPLQFYRRACGMFWRSVNTASQRRRRKKTPPHSGCAPIPRHPSREPGCVSRALPGEHHL